MRALSSLQCFPGSNPGVDAICRLNLLLVLSYAPSDFSPCAPVFHSPQKPALPKSNSTRNQVKEELLRSRCAILKLLFYFTLSVISFKYFRKLPDSKLIFQVSHLILTSESFKKKKKTVLNDALQQDVRLFHF